MLRVPQIHALSGYPRTRKRLLRGAALLVSAASSLVACDNGGSVRSITAVSPETHTFFPVASGLHAVDCNRCHGSFDTFTQFSCLEGCHAQGVTDSDHAFMTGYTYDSTACLGCHPQGVASTIDHTPFFPIAAGDVHGGIGCSSCHRNADRHVVTCAAEGCHGQATTDNAHAAVTGYTYASSACLACHPQGTVTGIDHTPFFPIAAGDVHGNVSCSSCHRNADRKVVTCAAEGCHGASNAAALHTDVGGYQWASDLCLRCHADAQIAPVAGHLPFGITSSYVHYRRPCLTCHPGLRTDKPFGADFASLACSGAGCHQQATTAAQHAEVSGYQWNPATCVQSSCHGNGRKPD